MGFPYAWGNVTLLALQSLLIVATNAGLPQFATPFIGRAWSLVIPLALGGVVAILAFVPDFALVLTWISLVTFPVLAGFAAGWAIHGSRWWYAVVVVPLFFVAMLAGNRYFKDGASLVITWLSVVTLGRLLVGVVAGIDDVKLRSNLLIVRMGLVITAVLDSILVFSNNLEAQNDDINHAVPAVHGFELPRLQFMTFGGWAIGYEDVFVASILGAVLAHEKAGMRRQWLAGGTCLCLGCLWSLLFWVVGCLPDTVPVALTCLIFWGGAADTRGRASSANEPITGEAA